jgi:thioredoxin-related protein
MSCQVLAFSTEDCPTCDVAKPIIKKIARKFGIIVEDHDPTNEIELAQKFGVSIVPTFVLLNDEGERIESVEGMIDEETAKELLSFVPPFQQGISA